MCDDGCGKPRAVYFKVDSSRISKVEPRNLFRPYIILGVFILGGILRRFIYVVMRNFF